MIAQSATEAKGTGQGRVGTGTPKGPPAPLDPKQLIQVAKSDEYQAIATLKRTLYSHSPYHFVTECLGVNKDATLYVTDPGVINAVNRFGKSFIDWLKARNESKKKGEMAQRTAKKVMFIRPRETMKSTFITEAMPVLASVWDPDISCAISSYKFEKVAQKFGKAARDHWTGDSETSQLVPLFGVFKDPKGKNPWNDGSAEICCRTRPRPDPTLAVFSVETGGTSGHYDLVILDDPVAQEQVEKYKDRWFEKCWEHYKSLGMITNQDGMFVLVMTRYGEGDLCGLIIEREIEAKVRELDLPDAPEGQLPEDWDNQAGWIKYAHLAGWTVFYDPAWEGDIRSEDTSDYTLNFPVIWPRERILEALLKDDLFVMAQLQNRPSDRADRMLDQFQIEQTWTDKAPSGCFQDLTIHMDIAWKSGESYMKQRGDYNVIQVWGHDQGQVYLVWGRYGKWTQEEFGDNYADALRWIAAMRGRRARIATLDKTMGGTAGSVTKYLQSVCAQKGLISPPVLELNRGGTKKLDRILAASAFWADGRVHLVRGVQGAKELADQMLNIGYSRHDDMADCAADVFSDEVYRVGRRTPIAGQLSELDDGLDWTPFIPVGADWQEEEPVRIRIGDQTIEYPVEVH